MEGVKEKGELADNSNKWGPFLWSCKEKSFSLEIDELSLCKRQMVALEPEVLGLNPGSFL